MRGSVKGANHDGLAILTSEQSMESVYAVEVPTQTSIVFPPFGLCNSHHYYHCEPEYIRTWSPASLESVVIAEQEAAGETSELLWDE